MEKPLAAAVPTCGTVFAQQMKINQAVIDIVKRILGKHTFTLACKSLRLFLHIRAQLVLAFVEGSKLFY